jgi:hypothetical protein
LLELNEIHRLKGTDWIIKYRPAVLVCGPNGIADVLMGPEVMRNILIRAWGLGDSNLSRTGGGGHSSQEGERWITLE